MDELPDVDLARAVASLAPQQRAAVALHYLDDLPVEDVAHHLGVSGSTVKQHLFRARSASPRCSPRPWRCLAMSVDERLRTGFAGNTEHLVPDLDRELRTTDGRAAAGSGSAAVEPPQPRRLRLRRLRGPWTFPTSTTTRAPSS